MTHELRTDSTPLRWGEIDGVEITLPVVVEEMNSATLTFTVPIEPARALLPGDAFEVAEIGPGSAMLVIALVDYVRNPWGDYAEVNLGLLADPVGDARAHRRLRVAHAGGPGVHLQGGQPGDGPAQDRRADRRRLHRRRRSASSSSWTANRRSP